MSQATPDDDQDSTRRREPIRPHEGLECLAQIRQAHADMEFNAATDPVWRDPPRVSGARRRSRSAGIVTSQTPLT